MGAFATGINVITTRSEENGYGLTANAFSSVSLDPPLVLICVGSTSQGCEVIQEIGAFAVNVLSAAQEPLSRFFASKDRPRGRDAFRDVPTARPSPAARCWTERSLSSTAASTPHTRRGTT